MNRQKEIQELKEKADQSLTTLWTITGFIVYFRRLEIEDKYRELTENWENFENWDKKLDKLPDLPNFYIKTGTETFRYQKGLVWARENFQLMRELRSKMITAKTFIDFLKASKQDRDFAKLKEWLEKKN